MEKKNLAWPMAIVCFMLTAVICYDWVLHMGFVSKGSNDAVLSALIKYHFILQSKKMGIVPMFVMVRIFFCVALPAMYLLSMSYKVNENENEESIVYWHMTTLTTAGIIILGFAKLPYLYSLIIFPVAFFTFWVAAAKSINAIRPNVSEDLTGEVSCKDANEMSFEFRTDKGLMRVHSPQQGIFIEGGAGSGKSASIIEPLLNQACNKGYAGFVYDFKGNPPTLTKTVYNSLARKHAAGDTSVKFAFMNFVDLTRTVRANPISPKYLISDLHVTEAATTLMLNLNKSWIEKRDFWADNAISILDATIRHFRKHHPEYCTLPHVITAILTNYKGLLNFLSQDEDIKRAILPVIVAHESNAGGQTAGAISSIQLPLNKLYTPEVFWVLGADDFDLDITNKENPRILCVANDPRLMEALAPCIALVASCCMQQMNQQGKNKSMFTVDELPTIYIHKLDNLPATARSNKVVTCLSVQSYAQLERDYGKSNAEVIVGNLGNQFIGMTNENRTAERIQRMFGEKKFTDYSYSESDSGTSRSESTKKENVFQLRDIMGQAIGHFSGKVAGGEPPLFSAQFPFVAPSNNKVYLNHVSKSKEFLFEDTPIPPFALDTLPNRTGEEKIDASLFAKQVQKNFERIKNEIRDLLEPFQPLNE